MNPEHNQLRLLIEQQGYTLGPYRDGYQMIDMNENENVVAAGALYSISGPLFAVIEYIGVMANHDHDQLLAPLIANFLQDYGYLVQQGPDWIDHQRVLSVQMPNSFPPLP